MMQENQKLMIDFNDYVHVVIRMLNQCIKEPHRSFDFNFISYVIDVSRRQQICSNRRDSVELGNGLQCLDSVERGKRLQLSLCSLWAMALNHTCKSHLAQRSKNLLAGELAICTKTKYAPTTATKNESLGTYPTCKYRSYFYGLEIAWKIVRLCLKSGRS